MDNPLFWTRILYLTVAAILAWGCIRQLYGMDVPRVWYMLVLTLAAIAFVYHGYYLMVLLKPKKKNRKHKK